jgi:CBS domain-containing protein
MAKAARQIIAQVVVRCGHGSLPICGEGNKLKSLITDRDIVGKVITAAKDPRAVRVGEPARGGVVTGGAGDSAEEMLATMRRHQVRRLPVIDGQKMIGIMALTDVARALNDPPVSALSKALSVDR